MIRKLTSMVLSRLLYGGSSKLRFYERKCLKCLRDKLSKDAAAILDVQVDKISLIQRFSKDKLVVFHFIDESQAMSLFSNQSEEYYAARLNIKFTPKVRCEFVFHKGKLSSMEFDRPPKLLDQDMECAGIIFNGDLMTNAAVNDSSPKNVVVSDLSNLGSLYSLTDVRPPASPSEISWFLGRSPDSFPSDYVKLLEQTDGFTVNNWEFNGIRSSTIIQDQANYVLLVECQGKALCIREGESSPRVYVYDMIDDDFTQRFSSFLVGLSEVLQDEKK